LFSLKKRRKEKGPTTRSRRKASAPPFLTGAPEKRVSRASKSPSKKGERNRQAARALSKTNRRRGGPIYYRRGGSKQEKRREKRGDGRRENARPYDDAPATQESKRENKKRLSLPQAGVKETPRRSPNLQKGEGDEPTNAWPKRRKTKDEQTRPTTNRLPLETLETARQKKPAGKP